MYLIVISCYFSLFLSVISKNYLPKFESLPPPLVYYSENDGDSPKNFSCKAWPSSSEITLYSTMRMIDTNSNNPSQSQFLKSAPLHPLDSQYVEKGNLILKNIQQVRYLSKLDLHCLVKTNFGAVISRPFRVVEAKIGNFPTGSGVSAGEAQKVVKYFIHGNVAYIDCNPPESYPPAKIEFQLNGTNIQISNRYRFIKRPNSRRVTLLIQAFEPRDQGYYRCLASNPVTGEMKTDPLVQQLKIKNPESKISVSIKMSISGKEYDSYTPSNTPDVITVREGQNVSLFCIMESAPPAYVTTFKLRSFVSPIDQNRHISDKDLGILTIIRVSIEDEDSYLCSESTMSDTVMLKVQRRLGITQGPQDIRVAALGSEARFTCLSSDPNIIPQWYFNGKLRTQSIQAGRDSSLHIVNVRKEDLGVYQCVARSQDEWVTHVATLSLKNEPLFSQTKQNHIQEPGGSPYGDSRGTRIKKNVEQQSLNNNKIAAIDSSEEMVPPTVQKIDDNLAVLLRWHQAINTGIVVYYRIQYKQRKVDSQWLPISSLENEIKDHFFYVTNRHIKPQYIYKFRIVANYINSDIRYSLWSEDISFTHVYSAFPVINIIKPINETHARITWSYSSISIYPITQYKILIRRIIKDGHKDTYQFFSFILIIDPNATETIVGPLIPGNDYQFVVYGINLVPERMITQFSAEGNLVMPAVVPTSFSIWGLKNNSESNTRLMFIILGSLAGLMMLVIIVLVFMCYCRERKSIVRLNRYKDPAKLIHSDPSKAAHSSFLLASISAAANNYNQQKHIPDGSMERASLLGANPEQQTYCQQKRQPPSGGSGHDMSEEASIHETSGAQDSIGGNSLPHHVLAAQAGMMTPQPPAVTYYKIAPGPSSLPAGSLLRQNPNQVNHQQQHQQHQQQPQQYCQPQYAPIPQQMYYTGNGFVYPQCAGYMGPTMIPSQQMMGSHTGSGMGPSMKQDFNDMRSQDGGESVYSYFSQTSNAGPGTQRLDHRDHGTVEAGSQTINSNGTGSASHRHHRRKRRKTNHSGVAMSENSDNCSPQPVKMIPRMGYPGDPQQLIGREVMYDTPPSGHDPRIMVAPPGMVLVQSGMSHPDPNSWAHLNNTLTRRGTPTLFVEPPRIRDYSEYGIPQNQMVPIQPQQLAHLSQQNLHLHNQNLGGYRDVQA